MKVQSVTDLEQDLLKQSVAGFLRSRGAIERDSVGSVGAYEEFTRYEDETQRTGTVLRLHFVALTNGGIKPEGEEFPAYASSAERAIMEYVQQLSAYLGGCKHVVWRYKPELEAASEHLKCWVVYSRLAVYT